MLRRAVFSDVQRKALEKMFQKQKYISKPDRKKLATKLGLKDSQVNLLEMFFFRPNRVVQNSLIFSEVFLFSHTAAPEWMFFHTILCVNSRDCCVWKSLDF